MRPPALNGRRLGSIGPTTSMAPAANSGDRHEVADPAEEPDEAVGECLPHLAAVPAGVEDEGEEDRHRHQAEAEHVLLVLVEHRQPRADRPR